jgi:hypothetical protein
MTKFKVNLPFQVVGHASSTATLLLATTLAAIATRPEEFKPIETLVLDNVSDTSIIHICRNPIDLSHARITFRELRHLVLSIKRQERRVNRQQSFRDMLWHHLILRADNLESLCLIGWNIKRASRINNHSIAGELALGAEGEQIRANLDVQY